MGLRQVFPVQTKRIVEALASSIRDRGIAPSRRMLPRRPSTWTTVEATR